MQTFVPCAQVERTNQNADLGAKVASVIRKLRELAQGKEPFVVQLLDPSGNSFIEALALPGSDARLSQKSFSRSREQNLALGLFGSDEVAVNGSREISEPWKVGQCSEGHLSTLGGGGTRWVSNRVAFKGLSKIGKSFVLVCVFLLIVPVMTCC